MREFDPGVFERVVKGAPDRTKQDTRLSMLRAIHGIPRPFGPDDAAILPVEDEAVGIKPTKPEICRSNPNSVLGAADISESRRIVRDFENGRR